MAKGRIISVGANKGGVGKSSTVIHLAGCIISRGFSVIIVDADTGDNTEGDVGIRSCTSFCKTRISDFGDSVPYIGNILADPSFPIHVQLSDLKGRYDFVLVDTPKGSSVAFKSAATISDVVLVVTDEGKFSYGNVGDVHKVISMIEENFSAVGIDKVVNAVLVYAGIHMSKNPDIKRMDKYYARDVCQSMSRSSVIIPYIKKIRTSSEKGLTIFDKNSLHPCRAHYDLLLDEICGIRQPRFFRGESSDYLNELLMDDNIDD